MDEAHKKAAEKLDTADKIVNNPLTKMVAGMMGSDAADAVNKAGDHIKKEQVNPDVVGKHTKSLIQTLEGSMLPGQMTNEALYKPKSNNFLQGPPVVTAIQAIDQYGNVLAQA